MICTDKFRNISHFVREQIALNINVCKHGIKPTLLQSWVYNYFPIHDLSFSSLYWVEQLQGLE